MPEDYIIIKDNDRYVTSWSRRLKAVRAPSKTGNGEEKYPKSTVSAQEEHRESTGKARRKHGRAGKTVHERHAYICTNDTA